MEITFPFTLPFTTGWAPLLLTIKGLLRLPLELDASFCEIWLALGARYARFRGGLCNSWLAPCTQDYFGTSGFQLLPGFWQLGFSHTLYSVPTLIALKLKVAASSLARSPQYFPRWFLNLFRIWLIFRYRGHLLSSPDQWSLETCVPSIWPYGRIIFFNHNSHYAFGRFAKTLRS